MEETQMITFVDLAVSLPAATATSSNSSSSYYLPGDGRNDSQAHASTDMLEDIAPGFKHAIVALYVGVMCLALLGNGCVIYLVLSQRSLRNVTNYFIASLAASDALMALVGIPITFISNVLTTAWPFPDWMCAFATYFQIVVVFQNAYTFMAISLERYIAIMYPFRRRLTVRQCTLVIALTWFMSFGTPLPTAIVSRVQGDQNTTEAHCYEMWPGGDAQRFAYSMTIMVLQYFVPLAVLVYTYIRIVIVVWLKDTPPHGQIGGTYRSGAPVVAVGGGGGVGGPLTPVSPLPAGGGGGGLWGGGGGSGSTHAGHRESAAGFDSRTGSYVDPRKRIIKMMMTVVGIYGTCWLPIHLITILGDTNANVWKQPFMRYVWLAAHWLAMSSCMYNPIIYWWMSDKFHSGYLYLLRRLRYTCCRLCCRGQRQRMSGGSFRPPHLQSSYSQCGYDLAPTVLLQQRAFDGGLPSPHLRGERSAGGGRWGGGMELRNGSGGGGFGGGGDGSSNNYGGRGVGGRERGRVWRRGQGGVVLEDDPRRRGSSNNNNSNHVNGTSCSSHSNCNGGGGFGNSSGNNNNNISNSNSNRVRREPDGSGQLVPLASFRCDLLVDRGETIPLRKVSDHAESGLGSEDGDDSDEACPVPASV